LRRRRSYQHEFNGEPLGATLGGTRRMASWPEPTTSSIFCPQEVVLGSDPWPYGKKPVFVLSTRALPPVAPEAVWSIGVPAEIVSLLAARGIQHIYVDLTSKINGT